MKSILHIKLKCWMYNLKQKIRNAPNWRWWLFEITSIRYNSIRIPHEWVSSQSIRPLNLAACWFFDSKKGQTFWKNFISPSGTRNWYEIDVRGKWRMSCNSISPKEKFQMWNDVPSSIYGLEVKYSLATYQSVELVKKSPNIRNNRTNAVVLMCSANCKINMEIHKEKPHYLNKKTGQLCIHLDEIGTRTVGWLVCSFVCSARKMHKFVNQIDIRSNWTIIAEIAKYWAINK